MTLSDGREVLPIQASGSYVQVERVSFIMFNYSFLSTGSPRPHLLMRPDTQGCAHSEVNACVPGSKCGAPRVFMLAGGETVAF